MTTGTAQVSPPVRQDPRQVINSLRKTFNFNDAGIAAGVAFDNALPQAAFITQAIIEVVTAFNAGTTNTITVGTNNPNYNNIMQGADITGNGGAAINPQVTPVTRGLGRSLTAAGDVVPFVTYAQTGVAATTGQAIVILVYEGGWAS